MNEKRIYNKLKYKLNSTKKKRGKYKNKKLKIKKKLKYTRKRYRLRGGGTSDKNGENSENGKNGKNDENGENGENNENGENGENNEVEEQKKSLREKIMSKISESAAGKSTLLKYIGLLSQYALFSLFGFLLYAPAYVINIPNNTLENLLPAGSCKFFFNDKKICQDHVKCLFGMCDGGDEEEPVTLYSGGSNRLRKNPRLAKKLKERGKKYIHLKQIEGGAGYIKSKMTDAKDYVKGKYDKAVEIKDDIKQSASDYRDEVYEKSSEAVTDYSDRTKSKISNVKDKTAKNIQDIRDTKSYTMKGIKTGLAGVKAVGRSAKALTSIAGNTVDTGSKLLEAAAAPVSSALTKLSSISLQRKGISEDNIDQETCKNKKNETYCNFRKGYTYGVKAASKKSGVIKNWLGIKPQQEIDAIVKDNSKKISAIMKDRMRNKITGELQPIKIKNYMDYNFSVDNLRRMLTLFNMLEILFPDAGDADVNYDEAPKQVDVMFPWTTYGSTMGIKDKTTCLWKHITKHTLTDADFEDDKDESGEHKCFYCKDCTLQNTALKVISKYLMNNNEANFDYILFSLHELLVKYFDKVKINKDDYNKILILNANVLNKDIDIVKFLMYPKDSYRNSTSTAIERDPYGKILPRDGDMVNINGEEYHLRNILTQTPEMIRNEKNIGDIGDIDDVRLTYQILKELDLQNIIANIILQKEYFNYFSKAEGKDVEIRKDCIINFLRSKGLGHKLKNVYNHSYLGKDISEVRDQSIKKIYESFLNNKVDELFQYIKSQEEQDNVKKINEYFSITQ